MTTTLRANFAEFGRLLRKAGPYVALEIVLPGGTLFAFLLYLYRSGHLDFLREKGAITRLLTRSATSAFDQMAFALQPCGALPGQAGDRRHRDGLEPLEMLAPNRPA